MNKLLLSNRVSVLGSPLCLPDAAPLKPKSNVDPVPLRFRLPMLGNIKLRRMIGESRSNPKALDKLVLDAVGQRMAAKNILKTDERFATLVLDYSANMSEASEVLPSVSASEERPATMVTLKGKGGLQRNTEQELDVRFYETGTLVLTVTDRKSDLRVWEGTTVIEIDQDDSANKKAASARHALHKLLSKFP